MPDWKTGLAQEQNEEGLRARVALALGISEDVLARHPFVREGDQIHWVEGAPDGVEARGRVTNLPPGWI